MSISIRRATLEDVDFLAELLGDADVRPFLSVRADASREALLADVERSLAEPHTFGRFVIEVDGERAGTMQFGMHNEPSRIARLGSLAVHPRFRGRRIADDAARLFQRHLLVDLGFHRLEMEVYGFNERAQVHAERAGWIREGVKRRAYRHGDAWVDSVMYALLGDDLQDSEA